MLKKLRSRWTPLLLAVLLGVPAMLLAHTPSFTYGNPCHEEGTIYYSDASYTVAVGGNEYYCWWGHHVWGEWTPYSIYTYRQRCCAVSNCDNGVCRLE